MKVTPRAVKIYKPEILECALCKSKLKYSYTISNKIVQFSSGKIFRIKDMGYKCPNCGDDTVYFSQTANKLCFKGYTYSAKLLCMIDSYKNDNLSREEICDIFALKDLEISSRNIDNLYKKVNEILNQDSDSIVKEAFDNMNAKYNEIRISIDFISVDKSYYVIMYDYFTSKILYMYKVNSTSDEEIVEPLKKYINKDLNIKVICSIRPVFKIVGLLKNMAPDKCKFINFAKF